MSKVWQPLDPEFIPKLNPEYVEYHKANLLYKPRQDQLPWHPSVREQPPISGGSPLLPVGSTKDYSLSKCKIRVFTPEGEAPADGWPVFIFFHGGGWTLGNIDTENSFSTNMCHRAKCVVVSVDYRLAPECPYPAAVEDAVESLQWVIANKAEINVNVGKIATGGSSSGGNLAAILTHKAALLEPPIPMMFQLLVVPVTDTRSGSDHFYPSRNENAKGPGLAPARMEWFIDFYLPDLEDRSKWDSSPLLATDQTFAQTPNAWIGVGECDILRDEGITYGEKLKAFGKDVEIVVYKGAPHPIMAMDGVLEIGRKLVSDAAAALGKAFGTI